MCYQYFLGHVACRNLPWQGLLYHSVVFNNLVAEICLFYTQKHKKLFSQARSSRFLYVGYSKIMIQILSKEYEFEITSYIL